MAADPAPDLRQQPAEPAALPADFERLFEELAPYVLRVLPRMGVAAADLDDVAQEVFLTVHRTLPRFERRASLKTWVYGICIRISGNYRQRAHRRYEQLVAAAEEGLDTRTPARELVARRALMRLDAVLERLSSVQRAVWVLHEIEQLSVAEIAEALDCSKFTVYARLYAARRSVQVQMASEMAHD